MVRIIDLRHNSVVKLAAPMTHSDDLRTRDAVARQILENGPSTAAALSEKLGFTPAGIRRHLDALVIEGVLEAREPHVALVRGRGRPSKVFVMTDNGREKFEHSYDDLAVAALKFMSSQLGEQSIKAFAESRADDIIKKATPSLSKKSRKSDALANFLTEQGYMRLTLRTNHMVKRFVSTTVRLHTLLLSSHNYARPKRVHSLNFSEPTYND